MKHLDLFSGIGGFALAAKWAGFETVQFVEYEPYAQKVLAKNFPGIPIAGDIYEFDATEYMGVDLITGGFPCQPFSHAGKRLGTEDDRAIWPQMLRVIQEARPTWVLGENVSGLITMELDTVLSDLEGEGYTTQAFVIPAVSKDARHRRDRVWIVAHSPGAGRTGREGCMETDRRDLREEIQTRSRTAENLPDTKGGRYWDRPVELRREQGELFILPDAVQHNPGGTTEDVSDTDSIRFNCREHEIGVRKTNHACPDNTKRRKGNNKGNADDSNNTQETPVSNTGSQGLRQPYNNQELSGGVQQQPGNRNRKGTKEYVADSNGIRLQGGKAGRYNVERSEVLCNGREEKGGIIWAVEPDVGRVANGVPNRVDRLKGLGNAIVPQVAYEIIRCMVDCNESGYP